MPLDVEELGVDLLSVSAHKFYGPKGVGFLYVRTGTPILWQQHGGAQESNRRAGTENVPAIMGMTRALELAYEELDERNAHVQKLRDQLIEGILKRIPDSRLNGDRERRLPNNVNMTFAGVDGETLLLNLDLHGIAASSGSACTTGSTEPSHVLLSIGLAPEEARSSIRLSLGKDNTQAEIDRTLDVLEETVLRLRKLARVRVP